jgi:hypothetical protein
MHIAEDLLAAQLLEPSVFALCSKIVDNIQDGTVHQISRMMDILR